MNRTSITASAAVAAGLAAVALTAGPALAAAPTTTPTSLTIRAAHASVAPKHKDTLTVTLKSGRTPVVGATLSLESRAKGTAAFGNPVAIATPTDDNGRVVVPVTPGNHKGVKEQYRVVFAGDSTHKASHSAVITITVAPAAG